jgi:predicted RNA-binding protein with RPS1 domain
VAVVPSLLGETHFASLGYSLLFRWTPERRQLDYLRYVGASDKTAKEVQMFGLAPWLTERYRDLSQRFYEENRNLSIRRGVVSALLSILGTVGYYAAYVVILIRAVKGDITIGTLTFLAASFGRGRDVIQNILLSASNVAEQALYLRDLFVFLEMRPTIESPPNARPVPAKIQSGFVFDDVGFRYPDSERWAIRNVNFALRPGERVALVGIARARRVERNGVADFGAFIEIEEGFDGLVHVGDVSWTGRVKNPHEVFKKGEPITAKVLRIDPENRRVSLGIKQVNDIWGDWFKTHKVGDVVRGKVSRIAMFGAFVELGDNIEGLCHNTEIEERKRRDEGASGFRPSTGPLKSAGPLEPGKEYDFKIIKISSETRRIGLSYRAAVRQLERKEIDQYKSSKSSATATIGDAMKQKLASR